MLVVATKLVCLMDVPDQPEIHTPADPIGSFEPLPLTTTVRLPAYPQYSFQRPGPAHLLLS